MRPRNVVLRVAMLTALLVATGLAAVDAPSPAPASGPVVEGLSLGLSSGQPSEKGQRVTVTFRNDRDSAVYLQLGLDLNGTPTWESLQIAVVDGQRHRRLGQSAGSGSFIGSFDPFIVSLPAHTSYSFPMDLVLADAFTVEPAASAPAPAPYAVSLVYSGTFLAYRAADGAKVVITTPVESNAVQMSAALPDLARITDVPASDHVRAAEEVWPRW